MSKIDEYKNKFPFGLEEFAKALSVETNLAIVSLLYEKDKPLSKEEILKTFKTYNILIESGLRELNNFGIVARTETKMVKGKIVSKFKLNKIYRMLIGSCIDVLSIKYIRGPRLVRETKK